MDDANSIRGAFEAYVAAVKGGTFPETPSTPGKSACTRSHRGAVNAPVSP